MPGYFRSRESGHAAVFLPCPWDGSCLGGPDAMSCAEGYTGDRCGACQTGWVLQDQACKVCPEGSPGLFFILLVIVFVFLVYVMLQSAKLFKCGAMTIGADFIQTTALYVGFPLLWPKTLFDMFSVFSVLNFNYDLAFPGCTVKLSWYNSWIMTLVSPIIILSVFPFLYVCVTQLHKFKAPGFKNEFLLKPRQWNISNAFFNSVSLGYTFMAKTAFAVFNCRDFGDGVKYLKDAPSERCYTDEWTKYAIVGGFFVAIYAAGIPLFFYGMLHRLRKTLADPSLKRRFGACYIVFNEQNWWYDVWGKTRKLALIVIINLFPDQITVQVIAGMVVLLMAMIVSSSRRPFRFISNNRVLFYATICNFATMFCGLLFYSEKMEDATQTNVAGIIIFFCCFVVVRVIHAILKEYIAFHGTTMLARWPSLKAIFENKQFDHVFDSKKALNASHWAHRDMIMDKFYLMAHDNKETEAAAMAKVAAMRGASLAKMSDEERLPVVQLFTGDAESAKTPESRAALKQWMDSFPDHSAALSLAYRGMMDFRQMKIAKEELDAYAAKPAVDEAGKAKKRYSMIVGK
jgi:hypothetical protein